MIVHSRGEVVSRETVRLDDDTVDDHTVLELALADDQIVPEGDAVVGGAQPPAERPTFLLEGGALRFAQSAAMAVVAVPRPAGALGRLFALVQIFTGAVTAVDLLGGDQLFELFAVIRQTLRLQVRSARTLDAGPLVPVQPQPFQAA